MTSNSRPKGPLRRATHRQSSTAKKNPTTKSATLSRDNGDKTFTDQAFRLIRQDIIKGVRRPGEQLKLQSLRAIYGLGLAPLREALQRLATSGFVILEGQRGFRVRSLTLSEAKDLAQTRTLLEGEALTQSLAHGDEDWEASVVAAAYRLEKLDRKLAAGELEVMEDWERSNREFHNVIVAACPSPWLLRLRDHLFDQHEQYRHCSLIERRAVRDFVTEHINIRNAVVQRDTAEAVRLMSDHIQALADGFEAWLMHQEASNE